MMQTETNEQNQMGIRALHGRNGVEIKRWASVLLGVALIGRTFFKRSRYRGLVGLAGAGLVYHGVIGRWPFLPAIRTGAKRQNLQEAMNTDADRPQHISDLSVSQDIVQESSEESFPASDPPGWTSLTAMSPRIR